MINMFLDIEIERVAQPKLVVVYRKTWKDGRAEAGRVLVSACI